MSTTSPSMSSTRASSTIPPFPAIAWNSVVVKRCSSVAASMAFPPVDLIRPNRARRAARLLLIHGDTDPALLPDRPVDAGRDGRPGEAARGGGAVPGRRGRAGLRALLGA